MGFGLVCKGKSQFIVLTQPLYFKLCGGLHFACKSKVETRPLLDRKASQSSKDLWRIMNNTTEVVGTEAELPEFIAWTSLVLCSIILFVGILGNLLVIIVILTSSVLRTSTTMFLLNLSIADLLVLAFCTSSSLIEIVTRSDKWILGKVLCRFQKKVLLLSNAPLLNWAQFSQKIR